MKKGRILFMIMLATLFVFTGCGKKNSTKNEAADKRLEKSLKAYSLDRTVDASSDEFVDNVTIIAKITAKTVNKNYFDGKVDFKVDFTNQKMYLGVDVDVETEGEEENFAGEAYFITNSKTSSTFYFRADQFLEDWVAVNMESDDLEEEEEAINLNEILKVDFSALENIKEIETKNGITKIEATVDLSDSYGDYADAYDVEIPEVTVYFYIDEKDRITKVEFDSDSILDYINATSEEEFTKFDFSLEFKDYGKTSIDLPSEAKDTEAVYSFEDDIAPLISAFISSSYNVDDLDYDYDFDDDDATSIHYDSDVDGLDMVVHTY